MIKVVFIGLIIASVLLYVLIIWNALEEADNKEIERIISEEMTGNEYQTFAMRTNDRMANIRLDSKMTKLEWTEEDLGGILDACLGLSGEVGELNDMVKKWIFHEADIDMIHMKKELGDVCWYIAMMCESCGWNLDDVLKLNIEKLRKRYPAGFDPERSAHRKEGDF